MADDKRTINQPAEQAQPIDDLAASGSEAIEQWLRQEVVPVVRRMIADPSLAIPADQVFAEIRALHESK